MILCDNIECQVMNHHSFLESQTPFQKRMLVFQSRGEKSTTHSSQHTHSLPRLSYIYHNILQKYLKYCSGQKGHIKY